MSTKFIETIKEEMYYIDVDPGQLIYCSDTKESYFDNEENNRIEVKDIIYLDKESERTKLKKPLQNRIYVVKETANIYRYEKKRWFSVYDTRTVICTLFKNDEYIPVTLTKQGKSIAPRTLASVVYNDAGISTAAEIEAANKLTLCKTKYVYVEATENGQKVFKIPYPISDYDFRKNFMTVIIKGIVFEESRFTIRDDNYFVLNETETGLNIGELVLFVFYYNVYIDINDGVLLSTKNLRDRSVTEPKLDNDAVSTRTIIAKNVTNQKLADSSVDNRVLANTSVTETKMNNNSVSTRTVIDKNITNIKLADDSVDGRVIADNTITTEHLNLSTLKISSTNVNDTAEKRFVSDTLINKWNATSQEVSSSPKIHVSATEPTQNVKDTDIWVDITNFIFKVRVTGQWKAMGAVYN